MDPFHILEPSRRLHTAAQQPPLDDRIEPPKPCLKQEAALLLFPDAEPEGFLRLCLQVPLHLRKLPGGLRHMALRLGIDMLPHVGEQLSPDAVPHILPALIAAVCAPGMSLLPQPVQNFLPPDAQERPDQVPPHRLHAAQAPQSGSPEQMEKHSLRLIVHMMGHGDARAAKPFRLLPEGLVPAEPARFLQGPPFPGRPLPHVKGKDAQRDLLPGAELPHKGFVPVGLRPAQAVVHVDRVQPRSLLPAELL